MSASSTPLVCSLSSQAVTTYCRHDLLEGQCLSELDRSEVCRRHRMRGANASRVHPCRSSRVQILAPSRAAFDALTSTGAVSGLAGAATSWRKPLATGLSWTFGPTIWPVR
jgi:hypothetical protein